MIGGIKIKTKIIVWIMALTAVFLLAIIISGCTTKGIDGNAVADNAGKQPGQQAAVQEQDTESQQSSTDEEGSSSGSMYEIECSRDSDCGETTYGEKYCFQNGIVTPITKFTCMNAGSIKSYCKKEMADEVEPCDSSKEVCRSAECLVLANQPCTDSDGGKNYDKLGEVLDAELMNYKDECIDKHTLIEYFCTGNTKGVAGSERHYCTGGDCITGACVSDDE